MPIQLPKIPKNDIVSATPLPRAEAIGAEEGFNIAKTNVKLIEAVDETVTRKVDAYDKMLDDAAKGRAKGLSNKYNMAVDELTAKFSALPLGGDLSDQYIELKKQQDENKKRAMESALDPRTKAYLKAELDSQDAVLNRPIEMKYAQANVAKDLKNSSDKNENLKRNFMTQSAFFDPKDPTSYEPLDKALNDIDINGKEVAQSLGLTTKDSAGQPIYPASIEKDLNNSKSEAIILAANSLVSASDAGRAKVLVARYADRLEPKQLADITDKINTASRNQGYYTTAIDIAKEPDAEKRIQLIEDYSKKTNDPKAITKIGNLVASIETKKKAAQDQKQKGIYDSLADEILKRQNNPTTRLYSIDEIATNPDLNSRFNLLTPELKKKIEGLIERPTESDPKTLAKFRKQSESAEGWKGVPDTVLLKEGARLSNPDFEIFQSEYKEDNRPEKGGISPEVRNQFTAEVKKALTAAKILDKETDKDFLEQWNGNYAQFVLDEIAKLPSGTIKSSADYNNAVKRVVDDIIKNDYDNANVFRKTTKFIKGGFKAPKGGVTAPSKSTSGTSTVNSLIDDL